MFSRSSRQALKFLGALSVPASLTVVNYKQNEHFAFCDAPAPRSLDTFVKALDKNEQSRVGGNVEVVFDRVVGRRMIAKRDFKAGEVIFEEIPVFTGLETGPSGEDPFTSDAHKRVGASMAGFIAAVLEEKKRRASTWTKKSPRLDALAYFYRHADADHEAVETQQRPKAELLFSLLKPEYQKLTTVDELTDLLDVQAANAHTVRNGQGFGLFPLLHVLEHSCLPNVFWFAPFGKEKDDKAALRLVASRDIKKGDALSITYLEADHLYAPTFMRNKRIQRLFKFECGCDRCTTQPEIVRAFTCPKCKSSELLPPGPSTSRFLRGGATTTNPLVCQKCAHVPPVEYADECLQAEQAAYKFIMARQQAMQATQMGAVNEKMIRAMEPTQRQQEVLGEFHFLRVKLLAHDLKEGVFQRLNDRQLLAFSKNEEMVKQAASAGQTIDPSLIKEAEARVADQEANKLISDWTEALIRAQTRLFGLGPFVQTALDMRAMATQMPEHVEVAKEWSKKFLD